MNYTQQCRRPDCDASFNGASKTAFCSDACEIVTLRAEIERLSEVIASGLRAFSVRGDENERLRKACRLGLHQIGIAYKNQHKSPTCVCDRCSVQRELRDAIGGSK